MATTNKYTTTGTPVSLLSTGLNSMLAGDRVLGSAVNNISAGTANLDGYYFGTFLLTLGTPITALTEGVGLMWFIPSPDGGTDYEDGSTALNPRRLPDVVFFIPAGAAGQKIAGVKRYSADHQDIMVPLPSSFWKPLLYLNCPSGQLAASGNTVEVLAHANNV